MVIESDNISRFMIKIGMKSYVANCKPLSSWTINGTLVFKGSYEFMQGTYIMVGKSGTLTLSGGCGSIVGSYSKLICFDEVFIGTNTRITWECQLYDTNFHYVKNSEGKARKLSSPIYIGNNVWIGNRSTITKGCVLPDCSILASNSLSNKDYSDYGEHCLFAGSPAVMKARNVTRVFDLFEESELDKLYGYERNDL